jgi:hypothetical protein
MITLSHKKTKTFSVYKLKINKQYNIIYIKI